MSTERFLTIMDLCYPCDERPPVLPHFNHWAVPATPMDFRVFNQFGIPRASWPPSGTADITRSLSSNDTRGSCLPTVPTARLATEIANDSETTSRRNILSNSSGTSNELGFLGIFAGSRLSCAKKYARKKPLSASDLDRKRVMANKQERRRMHRLNSALERLRQAIPVNFQQQHHHLYQACHSSSASATRRLSKIKTLRLAISYIGALDRALDQDDQTNPSNVWANSATLAHAPLPHHLLRSERQNN